jgi:phosphoribosyl 1,2-cyclic phosphodiesterase
MMEVTVLASGSSGNALLIRRGETTVLVDAGLSARRITTLLAENGVTPESLGAILITHEHGDHCRGLKNLTARHQIPVFATALTADSLKRSGVRADWRLIPTGSRFDVEDMEVLAFSVPHDAADPVGFVIRSGGRSFAVLTDLGYATRQIIESVRGVSALLIETNHDETLLQQDLRRPWSVKQRILSRHGHLSNAAAAEIVGEVCTAELRHVLLGHLSRDCNTAELAIRAIDERIPRDSGTVVQCVPPDENAPAVRIAI